MAVHLYLTACAEFAAWALVQGVRCTANSAGYQPRDVPRLELACGIICLRRLRTSF